jgi:hypothetical protein
MLNGRFGSQTDRLRSSRTGCHALLKLGGCTLIWNNTLKTPLRYWVAVEVIGDELTLPRSLKHHRIAILAPAIHREPAPRRTLNDVRPTNPTLAETDGPEVTGLVNELNQFCFATLVARRLDLHRLRSAFGSDLSSVTSTTMLATV